MPTTCPCRSCNRLLFHYKCWLPRIVTRRQTSLSCVISFPPSTAKSPDPQTASRFLDCQSPTPSSSRLIPPILTTPKQPAMPPPSIPSSSRPGVSNPFYSSSSQTSAPPAASPPPSYNAEPTQYKSLSDLTKGKAPPPPPPRQEFTYTPQPERQGYRSDFSQPEGASGGSGSGSGRRMPPPPSNYGRGTPPPPRRAAGECEWIASISQPIASPFDSLHQPLGTRPGPMPSRGADRNSVLLTHRRRRRRPSHPSPSSYIRPRLPPPTLGTRVRRHCGHIRLVGSRQGQGRLGRRRHEREEGPDRRGYCEGGCRGGEAGGQGCLAGRQVCLALSENGMRRGRQREVDQD